MDDLLTDDIATPGTSVTDADRAASVAAAQAIMASLQPTFGVGGALIENATGNVVAEMHNNVLKPGAKGYSLLDPTAHGERQIVDWYYQNRSGLPAPSAMTVVTSLDPCAMCTGALLTAGFNVAVSSIDTFAGINYDEHFDFPSLPPALRARAQKTWGYYGVQAPIGRSYVGAGAPIFQGQSIQATTYEASLLVFGASVEHVRSLSSESGVAPSKMSDPQTLPAGTPVRQALAGLYAKALSVKTDHRFPDAKLAGPLQEVAQAARNRGALYNAVALIDPFGNLLICMGGQEQLSPIKTAFLQLTREYARIRWQLMNNASTASEAGLYLTHPKYCTFVSLYGPDPSSSTAVMTLGAYGSTMEGPLPQPFPSAFQYVLPPPGFTTEQIAELASTLPPLYTSFVGVAPQQVLSEGLRKAVGD